MQPMHAEPNGQHDRGLGGCDRPGARLARLGLGLAAAAPGARLAFGSDWPVVGMNPFHGLHVAVNRQTRKRPTRRRLAAGARSLTLEQALAGLHHGTPPTRRSWRTTRAHWRRASGRTW